MRNIIINNKQLLFLVENIKNKRNLSEIASLNRLILLDVDDTLLSPQDIYIYRQLPTDDEEITLTPHEYSKENVTPETRQYYDYRDFEDTDTIKNSITTGKPIVANLEIMDDLLIRGYKLGILTARGMEDTVFEGLKDFLMYKNKAGDLIKIGDRLSRDLVFAINDIDRVKNLAGATDFEKKAEVIKTLLDTFDQIIFIDDDIKNIKAIKEMKRHLPDEEKNKLYVMSAKEN